MERQKRTHGRRKQLNSAGPQALKRSASLCLAGQSGKAAPTPVEGWCRCCLLQMETIIGLTITDMELAQAPWDWLNAAVAIRLDTLNRAHLKVDLANAMKVTCTHGSGSESVRIVSAGARSLSAASTDPAQAVFSVLRISLRSATPLSAPSNATSLSARLRAV